MLVIFLKNKKLFILFAIATILFIILFLSVYSFVGVKTIGQSVRALEKSNFNKSKDIKSNNQISLSASSNNYITEIRHQQNVNDYTTTTFLEDNSKNNLKANLVGVKTPDKYINGYIVLFDVQSVKQKKKELKFQKLDAKAIALQLEKYASELQKKQEEIKSEMSKTLNKDLSKEIVISEFKGELVSGIVLNLSEGEAKKIENIKGIKSISPNYFVQANLMDSTNIIYAKNLWNCQPVDPRNRDNQAISINNFPCLTGEGIKIAVIDTGVDYTRPDLGGCLGPDCKVIGGYDFVNNDDDPIDDMGHGTHCAAIAAGNGVLKGVAPNANILAYKVLNAGGGGYFDDVISGIEQAVIDNVDIVNLSLGSSEGNPDDVVSGVVDLAVDLGVTVVVAAGNSGPQENTIGSPGTARKAITVGATDKQDNLAVFSSQGPVLWNNNRNILVKPDIVAPGVDICAAQFDDWLNDYSCLDDGEHIAIDGTSMATPHVAGAVALLKQKYPTSTPEEIKQLLKNGADDIWNDVDEEYITQHGAGRLNIYKSVKLGVNVPIAKLTMENNNLTGIVDIAGTVRSDNLNYYIVYYKPKELPQDSWQQVCSGNQNIDNGILCSGFDTTILDDKDIIFKLEVYDNSGNLSKDISINNINNFGITDFGVNDYIKRKERILGFINTQDYSAYKIEYNSLENSEWQELCINSGIISSEGVICDYNFSNFENGIYNFRLAIQQNGNWLVDKNIKRSVFNELIDNSPLFLPCMSVRNPLLANIDGQSKFVFTTYQYCVGNIYFGYFAGHELVTVNEDLEYNLIPQLSFPDGTNYYFGSYAKQANIGDSLAINSEHWEGCYYGGVIDPSGNYLSNWPIESCDNWDYPDSSPIIIGENIYFAKKMYNTINENDQQISQATLYLFGFTRSGDILPNYPVEIKNMNLATGNIYDIKLGLIKEIDESKIGLLYAIYNTNPNSLNLFFNIYLEDGTQQNHTLIAELGDKMLESIDFVSADFDNDGSTETAIAETDIIPVYTFEEAAELWPYHSSIKIINNKGELISTPFDNLGYNIGSNISVGRFDNSPKIVFNLYKNYHTNEELDQIKVIDYMGNEHINIGVDSYKVLGPASLADLTGDGLTEIIIPYHSQYFTIMEQPAGVFIFDNEGHLLKDIAIPTIDSTNIINGDHFPAITDLDNDGFVDIVLQSTSASLIRPLDARIFAFKTDYPYNPDTIDWTQDMYNERNTSCYKCD